MQSATLCEMWTAYESKSYGLVTEVVPGSPGARAGLQPLDVITEFDGKPIKRSSDLPWLASTAGIGKQVRVKLIRKGKTRTVTVTILP